MKIQVGLNTTDGFEKKKKKIRPGQSGVKKESSAFESVFQSNSSPSARRVIVYLGGRKDIFQVF